jgi:transposase
MPYRQLGFTKSLSNSWLSYGEGEPIRPSRILNRRIGRPRADDSIALNRILYVLVTGRRRMAVPIRYGHYSTAYKSLKGEIGE